MSKEFIVPLFKDLHPVQINEAEIKIKKSKFYNENYMPKEPTDEKFQQSFIKLKNGVNLKTKDYRILAYSIDVLDKEGCFNDYVSSFKNNVNRFIGYRGFVRPLLSYIYNYYDNKKVSDMTFYLLIYIFNKLLDNIKYKELIQTVKNHSPKEEYLREIEILFTKASNVKDLDNLLVSYAMKDTDKFYFKCMSGFIIKNYNDETLYDSCIKCVNSMDLSMQQEVFKGIIGKYINNVNVEEYPDLWFKESGKILKDPYVGRNTRWDVLGEDYKETYRRWNNTKYLYDFFENKVGGDKQRLEFWKRYINSIYRIKYFSELNDALVMEFKEHVFVELAQYGNAMYVYKKDIYNIDKIEQHIGLHSKTRCIKFLKDVSIMDDKFSHRGNWKSDFKYELKRRGYYQDRW